MATLVGNIIFSPAVNCRASIAPKPCWHVSASIGNTRTLLSRQKVAQWDFSHHLYPSAFPLCQLCQPSSEEGAPAAVPPLTLPLTAFSAIQNSCQHLPAPREGNLTRTLKERTGQQSGNVATEGSSGFAWLQDARRSAARTRPLDGTS